MNNKLNINKRLILNTYVSSTSFLKQVVKHISIVYEPKTITMTGINKLDASFVMHLAAVYFIIMEHFKHLPIFY